MSLVLALLVSASPSLAQTDPADTPAAFSVAGRSVVATLHGVGAQIYQCKAGTDGKATWAFREPVATLIQDGVTLGRHYAGPTWALADGGLIRGKVVATAPGAAPNDIPQLKLDVIDHQGAGLLKDVTVVLRLNTRGGLLVGRCETTGALKGEPYSADYIFLR